MRSAFIAVLVSLILFGTIGHRNAFERDGGEDGSRTHLLCHDSAA